MRKWQSAAFAGTAAAILLTAGCGSEAAQQNQDTVQPAAGTGATSGGDYGSGGGGYGSDGSAPQSSSKKPVSAGELEVVDDKKLGDIVADGKGFTLYRFDKDTPKPSKSNCEGECATTWPPVSAEDATATAGIDKADLGSVTRKDGTKQLTIGGWPAYRYVKDTAAGDTNGQGVGGTWNALAPDGKKAGEAGGGEGDASVSVEQNEELGELIVDGEGKTLYRFTKDSAWPMKSNCVGKCLDTWKPLRPVDMNKVEGVDKKLLTTFKRDDGSEQVSIDCWPLYTFTGDLKAGDTNGQGVNGTWFAVSPDGKPIKESAK